MVALTSESRSVRGGILDEITRHGSHAFDGIEFIS